MRVGYALSAREGLKRPELEKAIAALGPGDVLVLAEWDRATRSMLDGIRIIERVAARGATFKALGRQWLDLTTPLGKLAFLSALAEERLHPCSRKRGAGHRQETRRQFLTQAKAGCAPAARGRPHGARWPELGCGGSPLPRPTLDHCAGFGASVLRPPTRARLQLADIARQSRA